MRRRSEKLAEAPRVGWTIGHRNGFYLQGDNAWVADKRHARVFADKTEAEKFVRKYCQIFICGRPSWLVEPIGGES